MFKQNQSYLIRETNKFGARIIKIKVLDVTEKCYQIQFDSSKFIVWEEKSKFENDWNIIEDLGNLLTEQLLNQCK